MYPIHLKRAYDPPAAEDGYRVLVDRLWPRGLTRHAARIDLWLKDVAPSHDLRRWFAHEPARWPEFNARYRQQLHANDAAIATLTEHAATGPITLVFAARDPDHNNAVVLKQVLQGP